MRRSWPANLIAAIVIAATIGVGALGALGSPKANGEAGQTSRGSGSPSAEASTPRCRGRIGSGGLTFTCPAGWFGGENSTFDDEPYATAQGIISHPRPPQQR